MARKALKKTAARRAPARKATRRAAKAKTRPAPKARAVAKARPAAKAKPAPKGRASARPAASKRPAPKPKPVSAAPVTPRPAAKPKAARAPIARPATPPPALQRERRRLPDAEAFPPTPPSTLNFDRHASAARSGQSETQEHLHEHNESSPALTGGDVDADWEQAYSSGDEAPGGDNPTPDQDIVDEIGRALGVEYEDDEELKGADKLEERDKHRWELDPASSEDFDDRD